MFELEFNYFRGIQKCSEHAECGHCDPGRERPVIGRWRPMIGPSGSRLKITFWDRYQYPSFCVRRIKTSVWYLILSVAKIFLDFQTAVAEQQQQ